MTNIFVGNLGTDVTEEQLLNLFGTFGPVENITIVNDRDTGRGRGMAFVQMLGADEAQSAISSLNGKLFDGRELRVNEARAKAADDPGQPSAGTRDHRRHKT
jgi:cold-inducible RNA-binding protein